MPDVDALQPDPWVISVVVIGVGVTLWWLAPGVARHRGLRSGSRAVYEFHLVSGRLGALLCIGLGIAGLVVTARGG